MFASKTGINLAGYLVASSWLRLSTLYLISTNLDMSAGEGVAFPVLLLATNYTWLLLVVHNVPN